MSYCIYVSEGDSRIESFPGDDEIIRIEYNINGHAPRGAPSPFTRHQVIKQFIEQVTTEKVSWITPGYHETLFDLKLLRASFDALSALDWLRGKIALEPDYEEQNQDAYRNAIMEQKRAMNPDLQFYQPQYERWCGKLYFTLLSGQVRKRIGRMGAPVEIHNSLESFQMDHPDPSKAAFLIMRFRETRVHIEIYDAIDECLKRHGIVTLRADEKHYHIDLYYNILTYMHGCGFGVAVFDRIEEELFNPNISLEVGYMLAMQKPVCILKDRTLKTLHTDLMGKLYKVFDPMEASGTLDAALSAWLLDKALV